MKKIIPGEVCLRVRDALKPSRPRIRLTPYNLSYSFLFNLS